MTRGGVGRRRGGAVRAGLWAIALLLSWTTAGGAQRGPARPAPAEEPGARLTVYLMTMGPGSAVWERFGHNAIYIHDPDRGTDDAYNYGLFDFRQENFVLRFIQGRMWYWMAGFPAEGYVQQYVRDNRSVWLQELEMPPRARLELQRFLQWNEQPEHRYYHYDYYRDNCSTRVRDALDRFLGGAIHRETAALPTGTTYRFHTGRLTANDKPIFTGLMLALGPGVDRPISAWEEMFLPMAVRDYVRRITVPGPEGRPVPLVRSERTLFESTAEAPPDRPPAWIPGYLLLGTAIGGLALLLPVMLALWARGGGGAGRRAAAVAAVLAVLSLAGWVLQALPGLDQVNGPIIALALPIHLGIAGALGSVAARERRTPAG